MTGMRLAAQDVIAAWAAGQSKESPEIVVNLPSGAAARLDDLRKWAAKWPKNPPMRHLPPTPPVKRNPRHALRARRENLCLSQDAVGGTIGVSQSYLSAMERGQIRPDPMLLARWAAALSGPAPVLAGAGR